MKQRPRIDRKLTPEQQRLVETHIGLAYTCARKVSLPAWCSVEEAQSVTLETLCEVAINYRPDFGVLFKTYAIEAMRKRIFRFLDEMHVIPCSWYQRKVLKKEPPKIASYDEYRGFCESSVDSRAAEDAIAKEAREFVQESIDTLDPLYADAIRCMVLKEEGLASWGAKHGRSHEWARKQKNIAVELLTETLLEAHCA